MTAIKTEPRFDCYAPLRAEKIMGCDLRHIKSRDIVRLRRSADKRVRCNTGSTLLRVHPVAQFDFLSRYTNDIAQYAVSTGYEAIRFTLDGPRLGGRRVFTHMLSHQFERVKKMRYDPHTYRVSMALNVVHLTSQDHELLLRHNEAQHYLTLTDGDGCMLVWTDEQEIDERFGPDKGYTDKLSWLLKEINKEGYDSVTLCCYGEVLETLPMYLQ